MNARVRALVASSTVARLTAPRRARWRFGALDDPAPLTAWGSQRPGGPVDRWLLERWLEQHRHLVRGTVLEVKEDEYATALGAQRVEVVDIDPANPRATVIADLCVPGSLPQRAYDAAVVTQTLHLVPDPVAALHTLMDALRPGGALLLTVPCLSRVIDETDMWRWTPHGFRALLEREVSAAGSITVTGMGNGLVARAFLFGLGAGELSRSALAHDDPSYPVVVGATVVRHA